MKVLLFGATGMIGQGVLREALLDPRVESVTVVGRSSTGQAHAKLREIVAPDLFDLSAHADALASHSACLFCLGVSSAGISEAEYRRITKDLTLSVAKLLCARNPAMVFLFISGLGTDANGRAMWARVKGETENALADLPFRRVFHFRPGFIRPLHGIRSRTPLYRALYAVVTPLAPLLARVAPNAITDTERLGRAMLNVAEHGADQQVLETRDINALAR